MKAMVVRAYGAPDVIRHEDFAAGQFDTAFLSRAFGEWSGGCEVPEELGNIIAIAGTGTVRTNGKVVESKSKAWEATDSFRIART